MGDILRNTPWWVYALFVFCVVMAWRASRPRVISIYRLTVFPLLFSFLSLYALYYHFALSWDYFLTWLISVLFGSWFGWLSLLHLHLHLFVDKKKRLVKLPGSWTTLLLILLIFGIRYTFAYLHWLHATDFSHDLRLTYTELILTGIVIGLFTGRAYRIFYLYKKAPHTDLQRL